jgi:hypothetical protein
MTDVSIDTLESIRFRKLRVDGNVTLTLQGDVLIVGSAPRIYIQPLAPENPPLNALWIDNSDDL